MKETAVQDIAPVPTEPGGQQQTVLDALQASPLGPFLELPMPQLPALPGVEAFLPALPQLPSDPLAALAALAEGTGLPALPGVDQLLKPITDLTSGFGSGILGGLDPTSLLQQSSAVIDTAMQLGMGGLKILDQVWQSQAALNAQTQGRQAQGSGEEVVQRGNDISTVTQDAAATVQRGNAQLVAIAQSFAASAVAAAPVVFTPPGQLLLMSSAADHLGQALAVVAQTQAELSGHTATMGSLSDPVPVPAGPNSNPVATNGPSPFAIASTVLEQVGKPLVSTVTAGLEKIIEAGTHAAGVATPGTEASTTHTASAGSGSSALASNGHSSGLSSGGMVAGSSGGNSGGAKPSSGAIVGASGQPSEKPSVATLSAASSTQAATVSAGGTGMGMVPPMMPHRATDGDVPRTSPGYLVDAVNRSDVIGDVGSVVAPVLGAMDPNDPAEFTDYDV